jgi:hypothetical protein
MAQLTGDNKTWWFGDLQEDGFYDLKLAAMSGMAVNGSDKLLDLIWFDNLVNGGLERTTGQHQIFLDAKTGKLAFYAYLNTQANLGNLETGELAVFIADDNGITFVMKEGPSEEYSFVFNEQALPYDIGFSELAFINDRLVIGSSPSSTFSTGDSGLFTFENGFLSDDFLSAAPAPTSIFDELLGKVIPEFTRQLAINEFGAVVQNVSGRLTQSWIDNRRVVSLIRFRRTSDDFLNTLVSTWDAAPGYINEVVYSDFPEFSINKNDDIVYLGRSYAVDNDGRPLTNQPFDAIYTSTLRPDRDPVNVLFAGEDAPGYTGPGSAEIGRLNTLQMAGNYFSFFAYFAGDPINPFGTVGLYRANVSQPGALPDLLLYTGGPSNMDGFGPISNIIHVQLGPYGDIVAQVLTDENSRRAIIQIYPPDDQGEIEYRLLAANTRASDFTCENGCNSFTPNLSAIGFIPGGGFIEPVLGPQTGFGAWLNNREAGWVLFSDPFGSNYREYSVLFDLGYVPTDYGDAPITNLSVAPISVPVGYLEAGHVLGTDIFLGSEVDDGRRNRDANFLYRLYGIDDDVNDQGKPDDEDGISFLGPVEIFDVEDPIRGLKVTVPILTLGETISYELSASSLTADDAFVNGWLDFNRDGDWDDEGEHILVSENVPANTTVVSKLIEFPFEEIVDVDVGYTFARFRISKLDALTSGMLDDGEVEDYLVKLVTFMEFGDAPEAGPDFNYPTKLISNGARHTALVGSPLLGEIVDFELDGLPSEDSMGDDLNVAESDDEDGVVLPFAFIPGVSASLQVTASQVGKLDAWIDFNRDGDWADEGEKILDSVDVIMGENTMEIDVPVDAESGTSYVRFRISAAGGLEPFGLAQGGEVEDYQIEIGIPEVRWIDVYLDGDELVLTWSGLASLEASDNLADPWTVVEDEKNEYRYDLAGGRKFFRLVEKEIPQ